MCTASTSGSASTSSYLVYRLAMPKRVADLVQLLGHALADRVHLGVRMILIDGNELGPEPQANDRDAYLFRACHGCAAPLLGFVPVSRPGDDASRPTVKIGPAEIVHRLQYPL